MSLKQYFSVYALSICMLAGCKGKEEPIAYQITMKVGHNVAGLVMPKSGAAICQKGLVDLPIVATVDELSQQDFFQHQGSSAGFLDQKRLSTNISPENLYTFIKDETGKMILRVINRGGNGTKKLYSPEEIEKAKKESCS